MKLIYMHKTQLDVNSWQAAPVAISRILPAAFSAYSLGSSQFKYPEKQRNASRKRPYQMPKGPYSGSPCDMKKQQHESTQSLDFQGIIKFVCGSCNLNLQSHYSNH